jgi:hypothetical protein
MLPFIVAGDGPWQWPLRRTIANGIPIMAPVLGIVGASLSHTRW